MPIKTSTRAFCATGVLPGHEGSRQDVIDGERRDSSLAIGVSRGVQRAQSSLAASATG